MKLEKFGLPATFPVDLVSEKGHKLVKACYKGIGKDGITQAATYLGLDPKWRALPHMGPLIYGLSLCDDGYMMPFLVKFYK
jgi:hypothetical protein